MMFLSLSSKLIFINIVDLHLQSGSFIYNKQTNDVHSTNHFLINLNCSEVNLIHLTQQLCSNGTVKYNLHSRYCAIAVAWTANIKYASWRNNSLACSSCCDVDQISNYE